MKYSSIIVMVLLLMSACSSVSGVGGDSVHGNAGDGIHGNTVSSPTNKVDADIDVPIH